MGVNLGICLMQGERIAKKTVMKSRGNRVGRIKYDGEIMRDKVDSYMVNYTVIGSDAPKFSLKYLFEEHMFLEISVLVSHGRYFGGYLPISKGDNAGPHIYAIYTTT